MLFFQVFTFVVSVSSFIRVVNQQQQQCEKPVCPPFETRSCNGSPAAAGTSHGGMKSFFVVFFLFLPIGSGVLQRERGWLAKTYDMIKSKEMHLGNYYARITPNVEKVLA